MRIVLGIGAVLSFIAVADLPMGYYTFLRIYLTIAAGVMAYFKYLENESVNIWVVLFSITAIIFNPFIPIYLHDKSIWAVIDTVVGVLFGYSFITYGKK